MTMPTLANAELAIMDLLWNEEPLTARKIREQLYPDREKAQQGTVQKLLQRLEEKGFVVRDRDLSVHFYSAKLSRAGYATSQLEALADKVGGSSLAPGLARLIEQGKLSSADIDSLRSTANYHLARAGSVDASGANTVEEAEESAQGNKGEEERSDFSTVDLRSDGTRLEEAVAAVRTP